MRELGGARRETLGGVIHQVGGLGVRAGEGPLMRTLAHCTRSAPGALKQGIAHCESLGKGGVLFSLLCSSGAISVDKWLILGSRINLAGGM